MSGFVQEVEQNILARSLLREGQSILVAVSGGLDSVALLHLLHQLSVEHEWKLTVAHLNHKLRGRASEADERFVRKLAARLILPCVTSSAEVKKFARERKVSVEMAARKLRHDFLARTARRKKIETIALAHQADDQVELFFVRLLRGAGPEGLSGMKWCNPSPSDARVTLIRPLLGSSRESIRQYARHEKIAFREDVTNVSQEILRNRVRHQLLPLLRKHYQPAIGKTITRVRQVLEAESEFVSQSAARWLRQRRRTPFQELSPALQRRVVQQQLIESGLKVDFDLVERLRRTVNAPVPIDPNRTVLREATGRVRTQEIQRPEFDSNWARVDLRAGEGRALFDRVELRWRIEPVQVRGLLLPKATLGCEYFDADKVGPAIILRHWQPGDRFQPIGLPASVKLQDLFGNRKIPRAARHHLTVAATPGGDLIWVEGLRISDRFKLDKHTLRRLKWNWKRCE